MHLPVFILRRSTLEQYGASRVRGFRVAAPRLLPGEAPWAGGEWRVERGVKPVLVSEAFEVGVALGHHKQDYHLHRSSYELYILVDGGLACYEDGGEIHVAYLEPGDAIFFAPNTPHIVKSNGLLYVILVPLSKGGRVAYDKETRQLPGKCAKVLEDT